MIDLEHTDLSISRLVIKAMYRLDPNQCKVVNSDLCKVAPNDELMSLIYNMNVHRLKRKVVHKGGNALNNDVQQYYKVNVAPLIMFFTDDTSGNRSKQYNAYESWSMKRGALSLEERSTLTFLLKISILL